MVEVELEGAAEVEVEGGVELEELELWRRWM